MFPLSIRHYTTALVVLLCLPSTTGVNVLFPYGPGAGDEEWDRRVLDDFLNVELNQSFPFAGVLRTNVTVSVIYTFKAIMCSSSLTFFFKNNLLKCF